MDPETKQQSKEGMTAKEKRRKYAPKKKPTIMEQSLPKNEPHSATQDSASVKKKRRKKRRQAKLVDRGTSTVHHGETRVTTATSVNETSVAPPTMYSRPNKKQKEEGRHTDTASHSPKPIRNTEETELSSKKAPCHPFQVDETDHCETPLEAYKDIALLLEHFAKAIGKTRANLRIYDPYYCSGGVKQRLASLGFKTVWNENADFYANIQKVRTVASCFWAQEVLAHPGVQHPWNCRAARQTMMSFLPTRRTQEHTLKNF